ncbi:GlcG/HbpS family heme-binding protein [Prosthecomicrobium hirschii]|uniref:GlcG/HbpS family heme-binding protein n=1 Tax=Prosthecodimorpha hirschii TaxID=665126 RepID=UPI00221EAFCC|nr:heme-binding protein [Prosthecomicrobium hirschii]MCW1841930.1 heme-binding protein [Prosthecomicrobium hirschii]
MRLAKTLSDADARVALDAMRAALADRGKAAVLAVADDHGEPIALLRLDGAPLSSVAVATNKAFSAARLRRPSGETGRRVRHPETGFDIAYYGDPRYVGWGGGLPVLVDGAVAGAVAVSGLTDAEDEEIAAIGIAAILAAL